MSEARRLFAEAVAWGGLDADALERLLRDDLAVDLEPAGVDVTAACFPGIAGPAEVALVAREPGRLAGLDLVAPLLEAPEAAGVACAFHRRDGDAVAAGETLAVFTGPRPAVLTIERTLLNLVGHLAGVATAAATLVDAVRAAGSDAAVLDTRKTLPGLRKLQKYAHRRGGGTAHRTGLGDAVLVKDNHLAGVPLGELAATLAAAASAARSRFPGLRFVEVEVDTLDQLREVLKAPVDFVLLDNFDAGWLAEAVAMRDAAAPGVRLEASGGVTLETVGSLAVPGIDRVSVGAITHSARSLDLGFDDAG
ncbi:carboxylating nicotinate-nucleotide diphosphorylase [Phycisphaera mikurensis]|uniref:nicotinate-nucleotide diphosphorylase (carboxylating) n=1 Tax=Phycisphaera mikurensis (strain NBRC 102666 / KCTC 22515 / FYK2301M01) TaxID=1142394 RepID=I0IAL2_PHYMF|nr:carboxylating nicotinate-nucleotide diphosphorylase [Phycisphaera mikurensis]MBB6441704.1 nicotinate-nucleotide pyrophosphorylase (carboxylating) [Phycisphaera mikurensis]BAM02300.1 nicotinate-nucleotide pyrophosphorylase [carboxylating] [Phycisphaera mikurensis NBRC 102666]